MSLPGPAMLEPDAEWMLTVDAAKALSLTTGALSSLACDEPHFFAIRRKPRSTAAPGKTGRGCGLLYSRADVEAVQRIRRECRLTVRSAIRVFAAMRENESLRAFCSGLGSR